MPTLTWLTREEDLKISGQAPYRLLETVPELSSGDSGRPHLKRWRQWFRWLDYLDISSMRFYAVPSDHFFLGWTNTENECRITLWTFTGSPNILKMKY
jgi:hypothetical protein